MRQVNQYPIVWTDSADESELWVGSLSLGNDRILLQGGNGYDEAAHEFALGTVARVRRAGAVERIDGYPSLRLELRAGRTITIASLISIGTISELLVRLAELLPFTA
jgi:hypothetical protein